MIVSTDTNHITDPDQFGELMREYIFMEAFGCYSCFDIRDDLMCVSESSPTGEKLLRQLSWLPQEEFHSLMDSCEYGTMDREYLEDDNDRIYEGASLYTDGKINVGWYWGEGDGHLVIECDGRMVENTDCKCDCGWKWISNKENK